VEFHLQLVVRKKCVGSLAPADFLWFSSMAFLGARRSRSLILFLVGSREREKHAVLKPWEL